MVSESERPRRTRRTTRKKPAEPAKAQPEPTPDPLRKLRVDALAAPQAAFGGVVAPEAARARKAKVRALPPPPLQQPAINRFEPLEVYMVDTPVIDPTTGKLEAVLRRPVNGKAGPLPGDPHMTPPGFDASLGVCHVLSPGAVARCLSGRGYF